MIHIMYGNIVDTILTKISTYSNEDLNVIYIFFFSLILLFISISSPLITSSFLIMIIIILICSPFFICVIRLFFVLHKFLLLLFNFPLISLFAPSIVLDIVGALSLLSVF